MENKNSNRYDSIEYGFEGTEKDTSVQTTQKDGFITSQQYIRKTEDTQKTDRSSEIRLTEETPEKRKDKNAQKETVIILQLVVCILIALAAFVIKSIGGELYSNIREMYYSNLNNSLIIDIEKESNDTAIREMIDDINAEK